jgi:hypothetical protein
VRKIPLTEENDRWMESVAKPLILSGKMKKYHPNEVLNYIRERFGLTITQFATREHDPDKVELVGWSITPKPDTTEEKI